MASTTRIADAKDALCDMLLALTGSGEALEGVLIRSASDPKVQIHESIELMGEDFIDQEWAAIGRLARDESLTLTGRVYVRRPGTGESVIRATRARAVALVNAIEDAITGTGGDPTLGGTVKAARCQPVELFEGVSGQSDRVAMVRFEILTQLTRLVRA